MRNALATISMLACLLVGSVGEAQESDNPPAIRVKLNHPDRQLEEVLKLFKGARADSPAAALAAWKRASKEPNRLGKPLEALVASFNPLMIGEWKTLDQAEVSIQFDRTTGRPVWSAILPKDDGTFAALGSALVLSGGQAEAPLDKVAVDRLAGPGSSLMARLEMGTILAADRERLKLARSRIEVAPGPLLLNKDRGGLSFRVEPRSLAGSKSLMVRRLEEMVRPFDLSDREKRSAMGSVDLDLDLEDGTFHALLAISAKRTCPNVRLDPTWYDWTPKDRVIMTFAGATDPTPQSWNQIFGLADRVEKVDPTRADVVPLQVRLELLCRLSGIRLEADLLRHLQGISGWVGSGDAKRVDNALLVLHLDDEPVVERILVGMKPIPGSGPRPANEPDRPRWIGKVEGQALRVARCDRQLVLAWGDGVIEASLKAREHPEHSAGSLLRRMSEKAPNSIFGGFVWPERIPSVGLPEIARPKDEPAIPAIVWQLSAKDSVLGLAISWFDIDQLIGRILDRLPMDPPPDR